MKLLLIFSKCSSLEAGSGDSEGILGYTYLSLAFSAFEGCVGMEKTVGQLLLSQLFFSFLQILCEGLNCGYREYRSLSTADG